MKEGREGRGAKQSTFRDASKREVAEAPGEALAHCRVGRSVKETALRNSARLGRLGSRARGGCGPGRYSG